MDKEGKCISNTIINLENELRKNNAYALEEFWNKISKEGTPLIEDISDDDHVLVTFIYRAECPIKNVLLIASITSEEKDTKNLVMSNLLNTDLWYKTYKVRNDIYSFYYFMKDYPIDNPSESYDNSCIPDKYNDCKLIFNKDENNIYSEENIYSYFKAPKAEEFIWIKKRANALTGAFHEHSIYSDRLKEDIRIWVYLPYNYSNDREPYNLLTALDGWEFINNESMPISNILDNLLYNKKIPPTMAVLIDTDKGFEYRLEKLKCNDDFAFFIAEELMQWIRERYNVSKDKSKNIITGFSLGGLMSTYVAIKYPEIFENVLCQSGSFWSAPKIEDEDIITKELKNILPLKIYFNVGVLERKETMISINRKLESLLKEKSYDFYYEEFKGGHDYLCWGEKLAEGLIYLIGKTQ